MLSKSSYASEFYSFSFSLSDLAVDVDVEVKKQYKYIFISVHSFTILELLIYIKRVFIKH